MRRIFTLTLLCFTSLMYAQNPTNQNGDIENPSNGILDLNPQSSLLTDLDAYPAGDEIEGDYITDMAFTPDGSEVWVVNRTTNNITVFDQETREITQNIIVSSSPVALEFTDQYAVVACLGSDSIHVISLDDYSVVASFLGDTQPAKVRTSRDGSLAVVACDINDVAIVINLNNLTIERTIQNFTLYLSKFSFITSNPRSSFYWSGFEITPDNQYIVNAAAEDGLEFFEIATGNVVATIPEAGDAGMMAMSGDGNYVVTVQTGSNAKISRVDLATQTMTSQVDMGNNSVYSAYSRPGINMDGSKVYIPVQDGNTALVNLGDQTVKTIATGNTPDWVGQSYDYQYAIAGDYYSAVVDFETGNIVSSTSGISIQNGAVSPAGNHIVASDPLRDEVVLFYEFENPSRLNFVERRPTGSDLEADATYSVKFTPDGEKVLAINSISGTVSILNATTFELEKLIDLNTSEIYHTDITPDSKYALIAKRNTNTVAVIDLESQTVVAEVSSGGVKPDQVYITPDGQHALAINAGSADACGVINLTGFPSLQKQFAISNTGISWTNYGIRSSVIFDPQGEYAYLAAPFDEEVQVIDLQTLSPYYKIPIGGFPLQMDISNETEFGVFTAVIQKNDNTLGIIGGTGNNVSLIGSYPCGSNPTRVAYNPAKEQFGVTCSGEKTLEIFDINSLAFLSPISFGNDLTPIAVHYSQSGNEYVLLRSDDTDRTPHQLVINGTAYNIPALPIHHFDVSGDGTKVAIALPATDQVVLFVNGPSGWQEVLVNLDQQLFDVFPNPAGDYFAVKPNENHTTQHKNYSIALIDAAGKMSFSGNITEANIQQFDLPSALQNGNYFYKISNPEGKQVASGQLAIQR
ncbi:MAG: T9SS type A sorting domain-containing protein [Saprospiraceae bacterium]|nr:T9SS type A sorting domain-containing protein [Saprospiraceae bacterium]